MSWRWRRSPPATDAAEESDTIERAELDVERVRERAERVHKANRQLQDRNHLAEKLELLWSGRGPA